eukprot:scaffold60348_cov30-Tisochrysis_lutea.AAC.3
MTEARVVGTASPNAQNSTNIWGLGRPRKQCSVASHGTRTRPRRHSGHSCTADVARSGRLPLFGQAAFATATASANASGWGKVTSGQRCRGRAPFLESVRRPEGSRGSSESSVAMISNVSNGAELSLSRGGERMPLAIVMWFVDPPTHSV